MFAVINMMYEKAVYYGKEADCKQIVEYKNSLLDSDIYTYVRESDYPIAI